MDNRLTIADLTRELHPLMNRSAVQRYDEEIEVQQLLQKEGKTYPSSSLAYWRMIAEARAQTPPLCRPETAGVFLRGVMENPPVIGNQLSVIGQSKELAPLQQLGNEAIMGIARIVELLQRRIDDNPPPDKLLSMKEAHTETGLPYAILRGLRVKVGNRLYVRRLDCLRFIQEAEKP